MLLPALAWADAQTPAQAVDDLLASGDVAAASYSAGNAEATAATFSRLYFDVFEAAGLELSLGAQDRARVTRIEQGFANCIRQALERQPAQAVDKSWQALRGELVGAQPMLVQAQSQQGWQAFVQSLVIVLREGAEAFLVVAALAAFLRRSGQGHRLRWLGAGVGLALVASAVLAWLVAGLLADAGARRGLLLGAMVVLAAFMMAQMSAWIYARRSAERWNRALQAHMAGAADVTPWVTAGVAFVAVFREGAETMLFFQALSASAPGQAALLLGGAVAGLALLVLLFAAMQRLGRRLPMAVLFLGSAVLLLAMAVVFAGKGVLQLQLAGALPSHTLDWLPTISWLGLYPTREALVTQFAVLVLVGLLAALGQRRTAGTAVPTA